MPRITHSVDVARPPAEVFAVTNDIARWQELFAEYHESTVLRREEAGRFTKLVFRLSDRDGSSWQSWRLLDHQDLVAIAQRQEPLYPFRFMHLLWTYQLVEGGTRMTWIQDFELDPDFDIPIDQVVDRMDAHGRRNQLRIKQLIESGAVTATASGVVG